MTWQSKENKEFYISDLNQLDDNSFILGILDKNDVERLYTVEVRVNSSGELIGLKSVKRS